MVDVDAFRDNLLSSLATKLVNEKDELIFKALERFGITRDNISDYKKRLTRYTWNDVNHGIIYDRYLLDDRPIFNVTSWPETDTDVEHMSFKMIFKNKIEFFEEVEKDES